MGLLSDIAVLMAEVVWEAMKSLAWDAAKEYRLARWTAALGALAGGALGWWWMTTAHDEPWARWLIALCMGVPFGLVGALLGGLIAWSEEQHQARDPHPNRVWLDCLAATQRNATPSRTKPRTQAGVTASGSEPTSLRR